MDHRHVKAVHQENVATKGVPMDPRDAAEITSAIQVARRAQEDPGDVIAALDEFDR
jgi:hypothetical protein